MNYVVGKYEIKALPGLLGVSKSIM